MRTAYLVAALIGAAMLPAQAVPSVEIAFERPAFAYCERLFYTIEVSEVTGDPAIVHIRDESGRRGSAVPVAITGTSNPVPAIAPFEPGTFATGTYHVDVSYAGAASTASFELVDSGMECMPAVMGTIIANWLAGGIPDGHVVDSFRRLAGGVIDVPFETGGALHLIDIPDWVEPVAHWWLRGEIDDAEFAGVINYLLERGIIAAGPGPAGAP